MRPSYCEGSLDLVGETELVKRALRRLMNSEVRMTKRGVAWRSVAWRGVAWRGVAWRGGNRFLENN